MFEPRQIMPEVRLNSRQRAVAVIMDIMLLTELTLCIYWGQHDPDTLTLFFLKSFLPAAGITFIGARLLIRRLGRSVCTTEDR